MNIDNDLKVGYKKTIVLANRVIASNFIIKSDLRKSVINKKAYRMNLMLLNDILKAWRLELLKYKDNVKKLWKLVDNEVRD